eukprot:4231686-Amphidinium_carterae.1
MSTFASRRVILVAALGALAAQYFGCAWVSPTPQKETVMTLYSEKQQRSKCYGAWMPLATCIVLLRHKNSAFGTVLFCDIAGSRSMNGGCRLPCVLDAKVYLNLVLKSPHPRQLGTNTTISE